MGNTETVNYDQLGRAIKCETPFDNSNNVKTLTYYDNNGNIIKTKEQNNAVGQAEHYAVKEYEYDSRNRLTCVKVNDGERDIYTQYAYDNVGNMVKMVTGQTSKISDLFGTLPNEATWQTYEYDRFGNVIKATDALGQSETASYNLMKLPTSKTDKNGINTALTYNAYGSLTKSTVGTDIITNTYNVNNLMLSSTRTGGEYNDGSGDVSYTYDVYGNIKTETTNGVTNTYTYDVNGNRKSFVQKEGTTTYINAAYNYDNLNQLINVSFDNGIGASYTYDKNGRLKTENRGIVNSTYAYNKAGLVTNLNNTKGRSYEYTYRLDGRQICNQSINENGSADATNNYRYNNIGQLEDEWCNETGIDYKYIYDTHGNRIGKDDGTTDFYTNYTYDKNNRLTREVRTSTEFCDSQETAYTYDNNGNMTQRYEKFLDDSTDIYLCEEYIEDYTYNKRNQMIKYDYSYYDYVNEIDNYTYSSYSYDAIGRMNITDVCNVEKKTYWDGSNIVRERKRTDNTVYYRGINIIAQNMSGTPSYYIYNAHGDTMGLVNTSGNITRTYNNDAFGNCFLNSGTGNSTPFRYNGQYTDSETGLIYLRNRYYDPSIGRFTQKDTYWNVNNMIYGDSNSNVPSYPAIAQSSNLYVYCMNDPVNGVDPWGLEFNYVSTFINEYGAEIYVDNNERCTWVTLNGYTKPFYWESENNWYFDSQTVNLGQNTWLFMDRTDFLKQFNIDFAAVEKDFNPNVNSALVYDVAQEVAGMLSPLPLNFPNANYDNYINQQYRATINGEDYVSTVWVRVSGGYSTNSWTRMVWETFHTYNKEEFRNNYLAQGYYSIY